MWLITGKRLKMEIEDARVIVDPNIRDCRSAAHVLTLTILATAPILLVVTILSPGSPIVAGIMLGGGALGIALHRWRAELSSELRDHVAELVRLLADAAAVFPGGLCTRARPVAVDSPEGEAREVMQLREGKDRLEVFHAHRL